ncbi:EAL domain-containing protein [Dankookia rubra]|uniref:EAL domain-containing protein n=1 Tax=Dankookia rubra TaxID=1442381 RepID=A0A4R5Q8R0_9PROT|nr:EAL domain-containing protein [Dankookia rubra]TDH59013.1 EAL domain-containing protein [Dankookia rubra]
MLRVLECVSVEHDHRLVVLAVVVCGVACLAALNMLSRREAASGWARTAWLAGAGAVFGCGVWATHFVSMLAFQPRLPSSYEVMTTLLSAAVASLGAWAAFATADALQQRQGQLLGMMAGGLLLGGSIAAMHFIGMAAMHLPGTILIDPDLAATAVAIAPPLAALGLGLGAWGARLPRRLGGATLLSLTVLGMHYTAMAAVEIIPVPGGTSVPEFRLANGVLIAGLPGSGGLIHTGTLAIAVVGASAVILALSLSGALVDQILTTRSAREATRLRQLAGAALEGIVIHRDGTILDANAAFCRMVGLAHGQVVGCDAVDLVDAADTELVRGRLRQGATEMAEIRLRAADGAVLPVEVVTRPIEHDGRPATVTALRDISERKRAEERIRFLAHHDHLTGLPNRVLLDERLRQALEAAVATDGSYAVHCMDLDRFKSINDVFGHPAGDRLLVFAAERLRAAVRASDTLARTGGDEFVVVQPGAGRAEAASLARRLVSVLSQGIQIEGRNVSVGTSVGVALYPADGTNGERLLRHADTALYRAKREGRGTFRFFEEATDGRMQERHALEHDLGEALALGQLDLHYQPIVDCPTGRLVGFEALARWHHPVRGPVSPAEFVPVAEECGLILPLGRWALETACAEAATWPSAACIAVNLSPAQFRQPGLPQLVADVLRSTGLPADRLELEVTEGLLVDDTDRALAALAAIKRLGVRLALDDFGTGYASLSYLRRFPFDRIKIDRSFVKGLVCDADATAIVTAILALARSLQLGVTAEGVETERHLALLRAEGCQRAQGFLLGRPVPATRIRELLAVAPHGAAPPKVGAAPAGAQT